MQPQKPGRTPTVPDHPYVPVSQQRGWHVLEAVNDHVEGGRGRGIGISAQQLIIGVIIHGLAVQSAFCQRQSVA